MTPTKTAIRSAGVLAFLILGGTGCAETRISTRYYVELDGKPCPTNCLFAAEDSFRIVIDNDRFAFAYLLRKEPTGSYRTLFPHPSINGGSAFLYSQSVVVLPAKGNFTFPAENGATEYVLIISKYFDSDLAILGQAEFRDASVVEDIIQTYSSKPGTEDRGIDNPLSLRVGAGAPAGSGPPTNFAGHWMLVVSNLSDVGMISSFTLRQEIR